MFVDLNINPSQITQQLVDFIQHNLTKAGFPSLVIGLSGGIDSAVSLALGVKAIRAENIIVGIFPYGDLSKQGTGDAQLLINKFSIPDDNVKLIDIKPLVDPIIAMDPSMSELRKGNIMVRTRMILIYDLAKKYKALVLGTENNTENLLGYFTRFGDEASDIEPLINLYKTQVKQLAGYLQIPQKIIEKPPTAGMWLGQTDEDEFGFSYEQADQILYLWHDKKYKKEDIAKAGFNPGKVDKVIKRAEDNDFKHKLPYSA